ncbi:MAG: restriction endonuclease subunit S [Oscillospiraceae bacterium]|nr:restriction endonuclease subunit S [Oscillospiraceae bacterium]
MRVRFTEIFEDVTKRGRKLQTREYKDDGKYAIIDQGQNSIAGYTDDDDGVFTDIPAIVFGDHTRVIKYIDTPCYLGADGVKLLKAKISNPNYKYLYYALLNADIPDTGYNRHYKWLKEVSINLPEEQKQKDIVKALDKVCGLLVQREQQLAKLDELVKARFVELFGDPIRNTQNRPTTDFINVVKMQRGFDLPVQERRQDGDIPVYGSNGALDRHNVAKVQGGGVITGRSGTIGKVYYTEGDYWPLNTSLFSVDTHGNNIIYLANLLQMYDLSRFTEGTGVPTLNRNKFHNEPIIDVPLTEQEVFASFVKQTDKSKLAIQQSLEKLETLKKALMQQYFA